MNKKIKAFIEDNRLLGSGDKVIVALSGGADSVALLHILKSLEKEIGLTVCAAHFNHMIRGEEADRDEAFVKDLCGRWGVELYTSRADVPALSKERGESLELCGRKMRYAFLEELSGRSGAKIATAHHLSDNTETVLMNLVRGTGPAGLAGIPVRRGNIVRPLLCCTRGEMEAYCRDNALEYITDSTNFDDAYTRNSLRLNVLPALRTLNPSLDESVGRLASVMRDVDDYLNYISDKELKAAETENGYRCDLLLRLDSAVLGYALRQLAERSGAPLDYVRTELLKDAMRDSGAVSLGSGMTAVCAQGLLRIVPENAENKAASSVRLLDAPNAIRLTGRGGTFFCGGKEINRQKINKLFFNRLLPCDIITDDAVVRTRATGDVFSDSRRGVTKTLKKLMSELKIPRERRDSLLIVASGSRVLWIEGVGAAVPVDPARDQDVIYMGSADSIVSDDRN